MISFHVSWLNVLFTLPGRNTIAEIKENVSFNVRCSMFDLFTLSSLAKVNKFLQLNVFTYLSAVLPGLVYSWVFGQRKDKEHRKEKCIMYHTIKEML